MTASVSLLHRTSTRQMSLYPDWLNLPPAKDSSSSMQPVSLHPLLKSGHDLDKPTTSMMSMSLTADYSSPVFAAGKGTTGQRSEDSACKFTRSMCRMPGTACRISSSKRSISAPIAPIMSLPAVSAGQAENEATSWALCCSDVSVGLESRVVSHQMTWGPCWGSPSSE